MERHGHSWRRDKSDRLAHEAQWAQQHGEAARERQVIVSGWPGWLRRRHFRAEVGHWAPEGYVLVDVVEGPEHELYREGRCPTVMLDNPDQRVIVGTLRR